MIQYEICPECEQKKLHHVETKAENCSCHLSAPCSECENSSSGWFCESCGYESDEFHSEHDLHIMAEIERYRTLIEAGAQKFINDSGIELPQATYYDIRDGRSGKCVEFRYHHDNVYYFSHGDSGYEAIKAYYDQGVKYSLERVDVKLMGMHVPYLPLIAGEAGFVSDENVVKEAIQKIKEKADKEAMERKMPIWAVGRYFDDHLEAYECKNVDYATAYTYLQNTKNGYYVKYRIKKMVD